MVEELLQPEREHISLIEYNIRNACQIVQSYKMSSTYAHYNYKYFLRFGKVVSISGNDHHRAEPKLSHQIWLAAAKNSDVVCQQL